MRIPANAGMVSRVIRATVPTLSGQQFPVYPDNESRRMRAVNPAEAGNDS